MPKFYTSPPGYELNPAGMAAECRELRAEIDRLRAANEGQTRMNVTLVMENAELVRQLLTAQAAPAPLPARGDLATRLRTLADLCRLEGEHDEAEVCDEAAAVVASQAAPAPQAAVQPLTVRQLADITAPWSFIRSDHSIGIAQATERACAAAWGVTLADTATTAKG